MPGEHFSSAILRIHTPLFRPNPSTGCPPPSAVQNCLWSFVIGWSGRIIYHQYNEVMIKRKGRTTVESRIELCMQMPASAGSFLCALAGPEVSRGGLRSWGVLTIKEWREIVFGIGLNICRAAGDKRAVDWQWAVTFITPVANPPTPALVLMTTLLSVPGVKHRTKEAFGNGEWMHDHGRKRWMWQEEKSGCYQLFGCACQRHRCTATQPLLGVATRNKVELEYLQASKK
ncbi:hypothetical protein C8R43DRAFT_1196253 [Mycena crocata]|nr:hypothetical protein C8R43DRAFT_1196253 [Mycena crocata]